MSIEPKAWGLVEIDISEPFAGHGEVNNRSSRKVWGTVIVDRDRVAVCCNVVSGHSLPEVV